jgi:mono/diheme cytochrome c family protein
MALAAVAWLASDPALAGDPMAGADIAKRWCAECHATGTGREATDAGPSFAAIANDPMRTEKRLRTWLSDPHPPMPNPGLSRVEIEDVIAYLASLRTK